MMARNNYYHRNNRRTVKIVICGARDSGKTTLAKRLTNTYKGTAPSKTVGVDLHFLNIQKEMLIEGNLWDIDGSEIPQCIFNNVDIVLLTFSFKCDHSFQKGKELYEDIKNFNCSKIFLIGNKIDISDRKVSEKEVRNFAETHDMRYFRISALKGKGLENLRRELINAMQEIVND
jgi:small GTP-binding protein